MTLTLYVFDLDRDPMALILKLDLDMVDVSAVATAVKKLKPEQTDRQVETDLSKNNRSCFITTRVFLLFCALLEFFANSLQYKNANIANFVLALPIKIN